MPLNNRDYLYGALRRQAVSSALSGASRLGRKFHRAGMSGPHLRGSRRSATPYVLSRMSTKPLASANRQLSQYKSIIQSKRNVRTNNDLTRTDGLQIGPIDQIAQGGQSNDRERQEIFVKGVKLSHFILNSSTINAMVFRWALISFKGQPETPDWNADFFQGNVQSETVDFDSVTSGLHKQMYVINRRKFDVHAEGKRILGPAGLATNSDGAASYYSMETYIPVAKKLYYDSTLSTASQSRLTYVFWGCNPITNTAVPVVNMYRDASTQIVYFVDPS